MANHRLVVFCGCCLLAIAPFAHAQGRSSEPRSYAPVEATAYGILGPSATSGIGAAVRWPLAGNFSAEVDTSYRLGAVNGVNANVSLLFDVVHIGPVTPYLATGIGTEQYGVPEHTSSGALVSRATTALAVNAGGGVRVRANEHWGVRSDARWSNGLGGSAPEKFRVYSGVTFGSGR
jgi:hypothetical protein